MPPIQGSGQVNQSPMGSAMPEVPGSDKKPIGPIVGIVIIVLMLALGGLYFWGEKLNRESGSMSPEEIRNSADAAVANFKIQGTSDDISSIEADLNATDLNGLDAELKDIEGQL